MPLIVCAKCGEHKPTRCVDGNYLCEECQKAQRPAVPGQVWPVTDPEEVARWRAENEPARVGHEYNPFAREWLRR